MNLNQYVRDAVRTESQIEKVILPDGETFAAALQVFVLSGQILDMFKKNVFYGKPIDWERVNNKFEKIEMDAGVGVAFREAEVEIDPRIFHALIGAATEATELMQCLIKVLDGKEIDYVNVMEEFGDINWYEAIGCDATGVSFENILTTNIEKLRKRFPDAFTSEKAIERDLDVERNALQTGLTKVS